MTIELPIALDLERPMERPESPYGQCGACQYVGTDAHLGGTCPACGQSFARSCGCWPNPEFIEIWDDVVFAYNHERVEMAAVASAMYFEAHVFDLIRWGTSWLDPDLNWIGAEFSEVREKTERIWQYLLTIKSNKATNEALKRLFDLDGRQMLESVLGPEDANAFWANYSNLADLRNRMVHKAMRVAYRTVDVSSDGATGQQILTASIHFVPTCWVVFSKLWNEYIHKRMLARKSQGNT